MHAEAFSSCGGSCAPVGIHNERSSSHVPDRDTEMCLPPGMPAVVLAVFATTLAVRAVALSAVCFRASAAGLAAAVYIVSAACVIAPADHLAW